jgi:hypothetical protein
MQYLKQESAIDIETCLDRGGKLDVIACMEEPLFIGMIPGHVQRRKYCRVTDIFISRRLCDR